jgi:CubicO group peptidase (beta-lactamase class C family)
MEMTLNRDLLFQPGQSFSYSNSGYWILNKIVKQESGLTFQDLVNQRIADGLGLHSVSVVEGCVDESIPQYKSG